VERIGAGGNPAQVGAALVLCFRSSGLWLQGVEIGVGFCGRQADRWDAKAAEVGDEAGHIQFGHAGGPRQRQLTIAEQDRRQRRPHPGGLQHSPLLQTDQHRIGMIAVEIHHRAAPCLT